MRLVDRFLSLRWVLYVVVLVLSARSLWPDFGPPPAPDDDPGDPEGDMVEAIAYVMATLAIVSVVAVVATFGELAAYLRREQSRAEAARSSTTS